MVKAATAIIPVWFGHSWCVSEVGVGGHSSKDVLVSWSVEVSCIAYCGGCVTDFESVAEVRLEVDLSLDCEC